MSIEKTLRKRKAKQDKSQSGTVKHTRNKEKKDDPEFAFRESPLTVLIENSLHIKALYHIFVCILIMLIFDTTIYDLFERGKINIGIITIIQGFANIHHAALLWFFDLMLAISLYPCLQTYAFGAKHLKTVPAARRLWLLLGVIGLVVLEAVLIVVPVWDISRNKIGLACAAAVTCEMFRFVMKVHAVAVACAPRCHDNKTSLPTFKHYLYFLFAPTLVYRDKYPRTKKIRWSVVVFHFLEVATIIFYNSFLWERFILPYWSDYGKQARVEAGTVVRGMFASVLPGVISFLCGFYCLLHAWLNAFAEMMKFGDRLFYEEWWTVSEFSRYHRAWNRVVHSWLRDHIYRPLAPRTGRAISIFVVFLVSAAAHEVILLLSFGFFYPVLLTQFGVVGLMLLPITAASGRRFPNILNMLIWLSFFLGTGLLWSLYSMEYFARQNCPPSENDSFFIPKSWSCPEIVLKPNWKFQNPLHLLTQYITS